MSSTVSRAAAGLLAVAAAITALAGCGGADTGAAGTSDTADAKTASSPASLIVHNARVYTFTWGDPGAGGRPAADAPVVDGRWQPDATAVAMADGRILAVGDDSLLTRYRNGDTRIIDLDGAVVLPGLIESHGHFNELGEKAERVDVSSAASEEEMAAALGDVLAATPSGEWVIGSGWDEGAWADALPTNEALNAAAPDHPVLLKGRRGFGILVNDAALAVAGVSGETPSPSGGEVVKDAAGAPTGVFLNRAQSLINDVVPEPTLAQKERRLLFGLNEMVTSGYVGVHHAGVYGDYMPAYESLAARGALPLRVEVMLAARPENATLMRRWLERGPLSAPESRLQVRAVKAYYDGSLGSRGARLLEDYSDMPGHRGVAGEAYDFPADEVAAAIDAGFQVGIHAIGDAGNRDVLDFYQRAFEANPEARARRHRIEHAQIVHPDDFSRFGELNLVASMEPGHAVEDSPWAESRVGPERIRGAYAWRSLRRGGATLIFNSDLAGTDYDIFYGLHCAVTRTDRDGEPAGGWYPEQALTIEEALRAYTVWPAYTSGREALTGTLAPGMLADLTVLSTDPFAAAQALAENPRALLDGEVRMTIIAGEVAFDARSAAEVGSLDTGEDR